MSELPNPKFALLSVAALEPIGAFLDWGQPKDLFLPYSEQTRALRMGDQVFVAISEDKAGRPVASMRLDRFVDATSQEFKDGQSVELWIAMRTDLGFKAIVNEKVWGVLYSSDVFRRLNVGEKVQGYIRKVRPDGKLDLTLTQAGHQAAADDIGPKILEMLKSNNGFADITDKSDPETIYRLFGVSKKKFKIALGGLYKQRLIRVEEDGIYAVSTTSSNNDSQD